MDGKTALERTAPEASTERTIARHVNKISDIRFRSCLTLFTEQPTLRPQYGGTVWHLIDTARMRPKTNPTAVVDDQLRVHGLQCLRVVDASVMPSMPSANTYVPTIMIAEKASDTTRGRTPPEAVQLAAE